MYQFEMHDADHPDHKLKNRPILYEFHVTLQGFLRESRRSDDRLCVNRTVGQRAITL